MAKKVEYDVILENVTKEYSKYNNDLSRILSVFIPWKRIEKAKVLDNINLKIKRGEKIAIIGRNGEGKSTILKIISNIVVPNKGKVTVNRKVYALLDVTAGFNVEFTGLENIYIRGALAGLSKKEIKEIEKDIIEFSEIEECYINQQLKRYSSGMVAKLGFAINIFCKPEILIIDEALAVGDLGFRTKCLKKIAELSKNDDLTLIFVAHDEFLVKESCDRGVLLSQGKIKCDGKLSDVFKVYNKMLAENKK